MKTLSYWQNTVTREWRWNLKAHNGKIIADSGESYKRKITMLKTIYSIFPKLQNGCSDMKLVEVQLHQSHATPQKKRPTRSDYIGND